MRSTSKKARPFTRPRPLIDMKHVNRRPMPPSVFKNDLIGNKLDKINMYSANIDNNFQNKSFVRLDKALKSDKFFKRKG